MHRSLAVFLSAAGFVSGAAAASLPAGPWSFTLRAEHVLPVNSDRHCTLAVSLSFARCPPGEDAPRPLLLRLPGLDQPGLLATGFVSGRVPVTPADTSLTESHPPPIPSCAAISLPSCNPAAAD